MVSALLPGAALLLVVAAVPPSPLHAQSVPVTGKVLDRSTSQPVAGAIVRFLPSVTVVESDSVGAFTVELQPGTYNIVVEHVAYGSQTHAWTVRNEDHVEIEIRIDPQAIRLGELRAEVPMTEEERAARAEGTAVRRISREELDEAAMRGRRLADILRTHVIGLRVRAGVYYTKDNPVPTRILCIEAGTRGNMTLAPSTSGGGARPIAGGNDGRPCDMVPVFRDGIQLLDPGSLLLRYDLDDLDHVEWLSAVAASVRFGMLAENKGVLLLHTRTGRR